MEKKKPKRMRKRPAVDDDGLGPDDVEFGFGVQSEGNVEGEEGAI
jgi:hypothetical protein